MSSIKYISMYTESFYITFLHLLIPICTCRMKNKRGQIKIVNVAKLMTMYAEGFL